MPLSGVAITVARQCWRILREAGMRSAKAALIGAALRLLASPLCGPAIAAESLRNEQIDIAYLEPRDPQLAPIYDKLKEHKVLEELRAFLAPLQLPRRLAIVADQCDQLTRPYAPGGPVTICYEYVARLRDLAAALPNEVSGSGALTRDDAILGGFVQAALQQTASAVIDLFDLPVWGREQDAADKMAALLMLQFGPKAARKLIEGATYFFNASDHAWTGVDFSDVDATNAQRYYNYICMAYGGDPVGFHDYDGTTRIRSGADGHPPELTPMRIGYCPKEYRDMLSAFRKLVMPHVDRGLLSEVLARDWLQPYAE